MNPRPALERALASWAGLPDDAARRVASALVRLAVATAAALLLSLPLTAVRADARRGFSFQWLPPLVAAATVAGGGVLFLVAQEGLPGAAWSWVRRKLPGGVADRTSGPFPVWAPAALVAAVAVLPLLGLSGAWTTPLTLTMLYATIAVGLQITIGMTGLLVLGHAGFWAVGAYTFGILVVNGWNFWIASAAAGVAAALVGIVVGLPALRLRGDYLAVATLGFGEAIRWVIKNENLATGGDAGLPSNVVKGNFRDPQGWLGTWLWQPGGPGRNLDHECYWLSLALLVLCVVCVGLLARSRIGRAMVAVREDEPAARCMGIDATRVKLVAFLSSAMWAGLAGAAYAMHVGSITPDMFDFNTSVLFVAMVVLGGLGSIRGAIVGALLLGFIPTALQQVDALKDLVTYRMLFFGALMAAMMVVRPEGLFGPSARRSKGAAA